MRDEWFRRLNTVKMSILPKFYLLIQCNSNQNPNRLFVAIDKLIVMCYLMMGHMLRNVSLGNFIVQTSECTYIILDGTPYYTSTLYGIAQSSQAKNLHGILQATVTQMYVFVYLNIEKIWYKRLKNWTPVQGT